MNNDLISRSALLKEVTRCFDAFIHGAYFSAACGAIRAKRAVIRMLNNAPAVDAEVVRHEGNTTFVTTDNLDAYADRIIVRQGNWCNVYYRDSDDAEVEGC